MINDLKKYFSFILKNEAGRASKNKIILISLIIPALFLLNKLFLVRFADSNNFLINSALSNLLFIKGISPYSKDIAAILENYFSTRGANVLTEEVIFQLPVYQLILYLPFSFIRELDWSLSLWLTANQCIYLLCLVNCIKIFGWEPNKKFLLIIVGGGLLVFFGVSNFLAANTSIFQFYFFILGLSFAFSDKHILAGLMLGLATIDPFNFFIPLIIVIGFLINRKQFEPIVWFIISIVLLSLAGIIFDSGWILKFFRNIFLEGSFFPFIDYNHALLNWIPRLSSVGLVTFIPIMLMSWLFLEFSRLPKQSSKHLYWMLSLAACINPFIIMRETNYSSILFILPIIFLVYLWENHSTGLINKVIYGILGMIAVLLPLAALLFPVSFQSISNFHSINLINSLIILAMLYWIRWWVVIPYDYLTHK